AYADDVPMAAHAAEMPLDIDRLQRCLEHLPDRERTVMLMTFYDDNPAQFVAEELGLTAAHVRVIRHRGVEHLRKCLDPEGTLT
ncbi:MAG: sigma-70 family RNA polymerase sigma factor, partial [bacterium]